MLAVTNSLKNGIMQMKETLVSNEIMIRAV